MTLLLIVIGMVLEAMGIGIVFPMLNLILDSDFIEQYNFFNLPVDQFLVLTLALVSALFLTRFLFLVFLSYFQNKFISYYCHRITKDLLSTYIHQDYKFFINTNTSGLIKNILVETTHFMSFFNALVILITELTFVFAVIFIMILIEPIGTFSVIILFGLGAYLIFSLTKSKLSAWGQIRQKIDKNISKTVHEGFGAIKEIKVNNIENFFSEDFNRDILNKARIHFKHLFVSQLPKNLFELISIIGLFFFGGILYFLNEDINNILSKSGLFVAASFRLIISLNKVISNIQQMKYYESSVDIILDEYLLYDKEEQIPEISSNIKFKKQIVFKDVGFQYNKDSKILNDINFKINKGEIIGITGESGSGKSTILDLLLGILEPNSGQIIIDEEILSSKNKHQWTPHISYVPQFIYLLDDTILNNIILNDHNSEIDKKKLSNALYNAKVDDFLNGKKEILNTTVGEKGNNLSGGQLQRVGIARALYKDSKILILDEFTSNIDIKNELEIMQRIIKHKKNKTIILTSHREETLSFCDRIFHVANGKIKELK